MESSIIAAMQLLTVTQYAKQHGVTTQSVYQRIRRGTLKTKTIKRPVVVIPVENINAE